MSQPFRILATVSVCALAMPAFAHHPGGIGNTGSGGAINTISASTVPAGITVVTAVYDRIGLDPLNDNELAEAAAHAAESGDNHAHIHSLDSLTSPSLNFAYGITNDLMLAVRLPYVFRKGIREGHVHEEEGGHHEEEGEAHEIEAEVHNHGGSEGIGDLSMLGQWRFLNNPATGMEMALLLGVKAPTGSTDESDNDGERFDAEFQPGSGSWDGMFGLAFTQRAGQWAFDANVLYTAVGEGTHNTDLGDRLHYNAAITYRIANFGSGSGIMYAGSKPHNHADHTHVEVPNSGPSLDLILELNGEWHDKQEEAGEADNNSGGNTLYVSPGLRYGQDKWSAFASVGIPVVNDLNGTQAEADWRLVTGVSIGF